MENIIEISNLTKYYGSLFWKKKKPSLCELNLTVPEGSIFGFLGPNGAGKTTTIKILMNLIKQSSGEALVLGFPPDNIEAKRLIGFLPDAPAFSPYLSAAEFLNICAKLFGIPSAIRKKRIAEVLENVKMTRHAKSKLGGFSRGMTQRIGIAQAILNNPKLLILDEPLVGLDPHGRQELKDIILDQKARGTSVFFCSHILSDAEKICDRIGILFESRLLCAGRLDELLSETGSKLHINPGRDDIVKELLSAATETVKRPDGGWELSFFKKEETTQALLATKAKYGDAVTITGFRESLEDFFFRKIEEATKSRLEETL
jgi:ABC-2 type transport system ATP-binding protein